MEKIQPVPVVGKEYHFWDDGKSSPSRHYICKCERIIHKIKDAKKVTFTLKEYEGFTKDSPYHEYETTLYDIWKLAIQQYPWLIAEDTDAFVEISCPSYDKDNLWAVRTKYGGWFTLDIQSSWQGGEIDVTGEKYNRIIESLEQEGNYEIAQEYKEEMYAY